MLIAAVVLVAVCGSPPFVNAVFDLDFDSGLSQLLLPFTAPNWDIAGQRIDDAKAAQLIFSFGFIVLVAVLAVALAKRGGGGPSFFAGWGVAVVAAGVAGMVQGLAFAIAVEDTEFLPGGTLGQVVGFANHGTLFGFWTGWIFGLIALTGRADNAPPVAYAGYQQSVPVPAAAPPASALWQPAAHPPPPEPGTWQPAPPPASGGWNAPPPPPGS